MVVVPITMYRLFVGAVSNIDEWPCYKRRCIEFTPLKLHTPDLVCRHNSPCLRLKFTLFRVTILTNSNRLALIVHTRGKVLNVSSASKPKHRCTDTTMDWAQNEGEHTEVGESSAAPKYMPGKIKRSSKAKFAHRREEAPLNFCCLPTLHCCCCVHVVREQTHAGFNTTLGIRRVWTVENSLCERKRELHSHILHV